MLKIINAAIIICLFALSSDISSGQENRQGTELSGEGVVVAYQRTSRHSVTPAMGGIATPVEFWIVRIDKWAEEANKSQKYLLVEYIIHERAVSDSEINSDRLRFKLRARRSDEHADCGSTISTANRRYAKYRLVRLSDYQRTKPGSADKIPQLKSLPCFIADEPPVVVEGKK